MRVVYFIYLAKNCFNFYFIILIWFSLIRKGRVLNLFYRPVISLKGLLLSKVILQGFIVVADSDIQVVNDALVIHKMLTLEETGCLIFTVIQDAENAQKFHVYEEFVDQAAFDKHQSRANASNWGEVTKHVERNYQISKSE